MNAGVVTEGLCRMAERMAAAAAFFLHSLQMCTCLMSLLVD
jgi:hypothetical protein